MNYPKFTGFAELYSEEMMRHAFAIYDHMRELQGLTWGPAVPDRVLAMHNQKSMLTVTWEGVPTKIEQEMMGIAWAAADTGNVEHRSVK